MQANRYIVESYDGALPEVWRRLNSYSNEGDAISWAAHENRQCKSGTIIHRVVDDQRGGVEIYRRGYIPKR